MTFQPVPFTVSIPDEEIADLKNRLGKTRWPDELEDSGHDYGVPLGWMKQHVAYWKDEYDWRKTEAEINSFPNFKVEIEDITLHFIHEKSEDPNAIPLILSHGWPGSFYEFHKVISPLAHPKRHGRFDVPAFNVVVPSMPGYGFSSAPRKKRFLMEDTARNFDKLMVGLGYIRFVAQGGDWGSIVTRLLAINHSDHCKAIHLNFIPAPLPDALSYFPQRILLGIAPSLVLTAQDLKNLTKSDRWFHNESGYYSILSTKPQTIGYSTTDSPAGLLAWMGEKLMHANITRDELITGVAIYWFSGGGTSTYRVYKENRQIDSYLRQFPISVPTGVSIFPEEILIAPKSWIKYSVNLKWYKENKSGGHFAAMDEPEVFTEDLRSCFKKTWRHASKI